MADTEYMLHKLQVGHFDSNNAEKTPRERADAILSVLSQATLARAANRIPEAPWNSLMDDLMRSYSSIVDCSTARGVNNYAEGALALSGHLAADSSQWKSSLDMERIKTSESYMKLLKASLERDSQFRAEIARASSELKNVAVQRLPEDTHVGSNPSVNGAIDRLNNNHATSDNAVEAAGEVGGKNGQMFPGREERNRPQQPSPFSNIAQTRGVSQTSSAQGTRGPSQGPGSHFPGTIPSNGGPKNSHVGGVLQQQNNTNWARGHGAPSLGAGPSVARPGPSGFQSHGRVGEGPSSFHGGDGTHGQREGIAGGGMWQNTMKRKKPTRDDFLSISETSDKRQLEKMESSSNFRDFKTARQQMTINNQQNNTRGRAPTTSAYGTGRKVLGVRKGRGLNSKFVPPVISDEGETNQRYSSRTSSGNGGTEPSPQSEEVDERLQGIDPKMVDLIMKEIMDHGPPISWDDIAGLEYAKKTIKEIVVWPMLRPDIFHGLRGPPKGLLLFGPPGTGKTLIGKCIASQSKSTFFSISASSLTSKWVGEGEKMVRALFTVARCHQPAVIFIDEIDSLLSQRSTNEHESSRRIKTEFLIQLDGATCSDDDRLLVVGATNRPQEIDEAARRRLVKRLYIPLPELGARRQIILNLLSGQGNYSLSDEEVSMICEKTDGYSGADVANLCREAALGPIRSLDTGNIQHVSAEEVRPISYEDFVQAVEHVKPSVSPKDLEIYLEWNQTYGSGKT